MIIKISGLQDHPCVCREKALHVYGFYKKVGSPLRVQGKAALPMKSRDFTGSPLRVQGKGYRVYVTNEKIRITPACAGKSRIHL